MDSISANQKWGQLISVNQKWAITMLGVLWSIMLYLVYLLLYFSYR